MQNCAAVLGCGLNRDQFISLAKDQVFTKDGDVVILPDLDAQIKAVDELIKVGMTRGIAVAVNYSLRGNSDREIWSAGGMSVRGCIADGVDWFDLQKLIPEYATTDDAEPIARYLLTLDEAKAHWIDAQDFLNALVEGLTNWDGLRTRFAVEKDDADLKTKVEDAETYLTDAREAYIEIVRDTLNH